jgi:hypothetical protein
LNAHVGNSSFSTSQPLLQLAWDSTSLGLLKECPRKYYLSIICGYASRTESPHLTFGLLMHGAKERYDHAKARGESHDDAVLRAVRYAMENTWDEALQRPWSSGHNEKNRFTLVRTVVWYFEEYCDDALETVILANGKPAVELSFSFPTEYRTQSGEPLLLCGHIDRLAKLGGEARPCDVKTTGSTISEKTFAAFTPHNQFSLYSIASKVLFDVPARGLIVDVAQVAVTFSRFERREVPRTEEMLDEWYSELGDWFRLAESCATAGRWPANEQSCDRYGGCAFRRVCSHGPSARDLWIRADFVTRVWDPLRVRGDI